MFKRIIDRIGTRIAMGILIAVVVSATTFHFYRVGVEARGKAEAQKQRDAFEKELGVVNTWVNGICLLVATPAMTDQVKYRDACGIKVAGLLGFYTKATSETTKRLVAAEQERVQKLERDYAARMRNEQSLRAQLRRLKEVSANVKDDQVGPEYWAAVNRVAGLQPSEGTGGTSGSQDTGTGSGGNNHSADSASRAAGLR